MKFTILNENYEFKDGQAIAVFKLDSSDVDYIMYAVLNDDNDECKILISHLIKDDSGHDVIKPISDIAERKKVIEIFKKVILGEGEVK